MFALRYSMQKAVITGSERALGWDLVDERSLPSTLDPTNALPASDLAPIVFSAPALVEAAVSLKPAPPPPCHACWGLQHQRAQSASMLAPSSEVELPLLRSDGQVR